MSKLDSDLDLLSTEELVRLIEREDLGVATAVSAAAGRISQAIEAIVDRLSNEGRLFYAGAGTSGRIAMLDAVELPPTFGTDPSLVQVIMAGGEGAFSGAVEGSEDDDVFAIAEVARRVRPADALVGIAASGTTPFTVAAVRRANLEGALTVGITCRAGSPLASEADIPIVVETGAEIIDGSTRMKAGTAQKLVLNTISTAVMIRLGRVYRNLMVGMPPTNAKLRERAVGIVETGAGVSRTKAAEALAVSDGRIKIAILMARRHLSLSDAQSNLEACGGNLREALER